MSAETAAAVATDNETTWRSVAATIREILADDVASGTLDLADDDACDEYAHEWADGSSWVIYHSESRALWADPNTPDREDEANDIVAPNAGIQERITAAVFLAVRGYIMEEIQEMRDALEADDIG